uniref:Uncharacterized protein n=1 Tax=Siphoviridae sp. ctZd434 TaxID=2825559 RepID=A0A8S5UHB9_9CAUD|nr:MAG TPA: hypothetical protein [Siphoviridae sp. ctZd434]
MRTYVCFYYTRICEKINKYFRFTSNIFSAIIINKGW